ncbi:MAG: hypothetical protein Q7S84_03225 [bacterium]|nr:hypothetical protein [bacterium]
MRSPKYIALLQSVGVAAYVAVFAAVVQTTQAIVLPQSLVPVLGIALFLLAFVTSALICAAIVFGYPATLFFDGKKREALEIVGWTMAWCVILLAIIGTAVVLLQ